MSRSIFAVYPVVWLFSTALNPANSLVNSSLIPANAGLDNFQRLASDPQHPFLFPFTITNHSLVFDLRNVSWNCHALSLKAGDITVINSGFLTGSARLLAAGQSLNIYCDVAAATSHFVSESHGQPISEAVLEVQIRYNVDVFGLPWPRRPRPTKFTWFARATTPQWISGEFAQ